MRLALVAAFVACSHPHAPQLDPKDPAETVLVTYRAKPGKEAELQQVLVEHWRTIVRLDLVLPEPHALVRYTDKGATTFVNILTWRSHAIPDNAPPEVQAIWKKMEPLVDGITFPEVTPIPL